MKDSVAAIFESPMGSLVVRGTADAVTDIYFARQELPGTNPVENGTGTGSTPEPVLLAVRQLDEYFRARRRRFDFPIYMDGTPFQRAVWAFLLSIPYGQTYTYGEVAAHIGKPGAARAVGAAVGSNPISIVVPCHRVVGAGGGLGGYGGGLDTKRFLLQLEGIHL